MRVLKSTESEKVNQLRIVRTNLPRNMSRYEHTELAVAQRRSREQLARLLSDNSANWFFTAKEGKSVVGYLWLIEREEEMFVAYLYVLSRFRRKGYGEKMVRWSELHATQRGAKRLSLHVFASNAAAIRLYEKCGFSQTNISMRKILGPQSD